MSSTHPCKNHPPTIFHNFTSQSHPHTHTPLSLVKILPPPPSTLRSLSLPPSHCFTIDFLYHRNVPEHQRRPVTSHCSQKSERARPPALFPYISSAIKLVKHFDRSTNVSVTFEIWNMQVQSCKGLRVYEVIRISTPACTENGGTHLWCRLCLDLCF